MTPEQEIKVLKKELLRFKKSLLISEMIEKRIIELFAYSQDITTFKKTLAERGYSSCSYDSSGYHCEWASQSLTCGPLRVEFLWNSSNCKTTIDLYCRDELIFSRIKGD